MRPRIAVLFVALSLAAAPQDPTPAPTVLRSAQQLAAIGPEHRLLGRLVGEWEVVVATAPPGMAPREERGRVRGVAILGGRHVVLNFVLQLQGTAVEAVQMLGFDTLRQVYTSSWRDDLSTWAVEASGTAADGVPERLRLQGTLADAREPTGRPFRLEFDLPASAGSNRGEVVVRAYDTVDGQEVLMQTQRWTPK
jgi:Protein of unknown function (DUF1579)